MDAPYWSILLANGKTRSQKDGLDWTLDIVTTGDILRVRELWMFCPRSPRNPMGSTATLRFTQQEKRCAFYFKRAVLTSESRHDHMIIGKILDHDSGMCEVFIWDDLLKVMSTPLLNNVHYFTAWRSGMSDIGKLSNAVIGL